MNREILRLMGDGESEEEATRGAYSEFADLQATQTLGLGDDGGLADLEKKRGALI